MQGATTVELFTVVEIADDGILQEKVADWAQPAEVLRGAVLYPPVRQALDWLDDSPRGRPRASGRVDNGRV